MSLGVGFQLKRIPLIVVLWEGARFHGRKRTFPIVTELNTYGNAFPPEDLEDLRHQFNAVRDLGFMDFDDTTHAIGIHAGPTYTVDEASAATISFFEDPYFGGIELVLPAANHPNLKLYGFEGRISSWRYNPPGTRQPGMYEPSGEEIGPISALATPSKLISPIPLVVQIFNGSSGYVTDPVTNYSNGSDNNQRCISLVEDSWNLAADFGSEFDKASRGVVVWRGPDYNDSTNDPYNWQARLYQEPLTYDDLKAQNEPAHRDLSPRVNPFPNPPYSTAPGVYPGPLQVKIEARGVRFVRPGRQST